MSTLRIDDLVERIHHLLNTEFVPGEEIGVPREGSKYLDEVVIVRAVNSEGETEEQNICVQEEGQDIERKYDLKFYEVEFLGQTASTGEGEAARPLRKIIDVTGICRAGKPLSKALIKAKVRDIANRDAYVGAPWLVKLSALSNIS